MTQLQFDRERRLAFLARRFPKPVYHRPPGPPGRLEMINQAAESVLYKGITDNLFAADPLLGYLKQR